MRNAPASETHHAYAGGLLEHTVAVASLCREAAQLHPRLNPDLLTAAALLHDIGRTETFTGGVTIAVSDEGRLLGPRARGRPDDRRGSRRHRTWIRRRCSSS